MSALAETFVDLLSDRFDGLIATLALWAQWQASYRPRTGYPSSSAGFGSGGIHSFDDMCEASDGYVMELVDSAIDDLPPSQRAAIWRRYGVLAVFRFPRDDYAATLLAAHEALLVSLSQKGVVL